jgi:hypothetical protein
MNAQLQNSFPLLPFIGFPDRLVDKASTTKTAIIILV